MTPQTVEVLGHSPAETVMEVAQQTAQQAGAGSAPGTAAVAQQDQVRYVPAGTGRGLLGPRKPTDVSHHRQGNGGRLLPG